ncbi:hypothetical protein SprV_0200575200 [Sparganum proliferum]
MVDGRYVSVLCESPLRRGEIPLGLGIATGIRVGQALGAGNPLRPKATMTVALMSMFVCITFASIILLTLGRQLCQLFRKDE